MDAEILIALKPGHHPTDGYVRRIRSNLTAAFPGSAVYFQPADIVSQVLNFGLSAPIDVQVQYPNLREAFRLAANLRDRISTVPGAADVHIKQVLDYPEFLLHGQPRQRTSSLGLSQSDVANIHARFPVFQRAGLAVVLHQPHQRRQLSRRREGDRSTS